MTVPLSFLIANEAHSRKMPSRCKHSTYEILIANEFQLSRQRVRESVRNQISGIFFRNQALVGLALYQTKFLRRLF